MTTGFPHPAAALLRVLAGLLGAGGVAAAAYAAHGAVDDAGQRLIDLAARIMMIHAAALVGLAAGIGGLGRLGRFASVLLGAGAALFAGVLLGNALAGPHLLSPMAPVGGTAMILGWLGLAVAGLISLLGRADPR